jgi:PIN domain nuclease of toxin-antitoxin system
LDSDPSGLIPKLLRALQQSESQLFVSAITSWEMSSKFHLGKWPEIQPLLSDYPATLLSYACQELPFHTEAALLAGQLPALHRDPFDRALIAQAVTHDLTLVSSDPLIHAYTQAVPELNVIWK